MTQKFCHSRCSLQMFIKASKLDDKESDPDHRFNKSTNFMKGVSNLLESNERIQTNRNSNLSNEKNFKQTNTNFRQHGSFNFNLVVKDLSRTPIICFYKESLNPPCALLCALLYLQISRLIKINLCCSLQLLSP